MEECRGCGDENCEECGYNEEAWQQTYRSWLEVSQEVSAGAATVSPFYNVGDIPTSIVIGMDITYSTYL